jgi:hypothetical protein
VRLDIEKVMAEKGVSNPKAAQIMALQTRQAKKDYDEPGAQGRLAETRHR